ncbi:glycosyltransferase family 4 protein [Carboxylicivirga sp. N1Y90]|uniref:glycosyltransferase family 4 protein n=1 Tax=Carboxylicivirga fragile TaxID=3417571 RepID=UPI003D346F43|nr:glycosyltransferase family 4 protein [Marinilabiliaceae bacterium N1Y90]
MTNQAGDKRVKLGLLFDFQATWMGGITYVINLVKTLNYLDDKDKPEVVFFYTSELEKHLGDIKYPYITFVKKTTPSIIKGFWKSWMSRKNLFVDDLIEEHELDAVYPNRNYPIKTRTKAKVIAWYADLQHKYYPEFFTKETLIHRAIRLFFMLRNTSDLVVSSQAVKDDFSKFYKLKKRLKIHVYHFVTINEDFEEVSKEVLNSKYNCPDEYFMVCNQFHTHKNHKAVLLALAELKKRGVKKHIVFTGSFPQNKQSPYIAELLRIIEENQLEDQISMLKLIPRQDQIQLMKNSQAIIQPSLFEGWSTVIEDARSLQVPVVASNIPVNIEQVGEFAKFFNAEKYMELADILVEMPKRDMQAKIYEDYGQRIKVEAENFLKVFN